MNSYRIELAGMIFTVLIEDNLQVNITLRE